MTGEQHVRINGKTFLYKQKAPFVPSGSSIQGGLEWDREEDKLRCHECGEWFENLGGHVFRAHGLLARAYKRKHGLKRQAALVNERMRAGFSLVAHERAYSDIDAYREKLRHVRTPGSKTGREKSHLEERNERNACPAQLLFQIKNLAIVLGHTPTRTEMQQAGISVQSCMSALNVRDLQSVMSLAELLPRSPNRRFSDKFLTETILDFYGIHQRLPHESDFRRGLMRHRSAILNHFGSMRAAAEAAGLGRVYAKSKQ